MDLPHMLSLSTLLTTEHTNWKPYSVKTDLQEAVNDGDSQVEGLLQEVETQVNLNQPVDQDWSHATIYLSSLKVLGSDAENTQG